MYNILTERLIRMDRSDGSRVEASLPEVYAALMADKVEAFPALRPHQRHAWHAFLVQLGAMAVHGAGLSEPPADAGEWRRIIRDLTKAEIPDDKPWDVDDPWRLVVDDITKPAFMQPPASRSDKLDEYVYEFRKGTKTNKRKPPVDTPDELDMLVTSKGHDLKQAVAWQADVEDWLFALLTLQTMEGYGGKLNYGISRMTSGYGNRPAFSLTPSFRLGRHFKHDLVALMKHRQANHSSDSGVGLLWMIPWDGTKAEQRGPTDMDLYYIEVCRRIRLKVISGRMMAVRANSGDKRMVDVKGLAGDPWAPVSNAPIKKSETPLKFLVYNERFGYERVIDGLFSPDWEQPLLLRPTKPAPSPDEAMQLVARGMVRNKGGNKLETWGYHERIVRLRHRTLQVFGRPGGPKQLEDIARERIEQVGTVKNILRHAVATFAAKGNSDFAAHRNGQPSPNQLAQTWANRLDEIVDTSFFDDLQDEFDADSGEHDAIRRRWLMNGDDGVVDQADKTLKVAEDALPCPSIQRFRARVNADRVLWGRIRGTDGLAFLFEREEENETCQSNDQTADSQMTLFE